MLTLGQLIKLGENIGVDIFAGVTLPENNPLDRDTLINTIIEKCGLNIPMYADPYIMASAITLWSARNQYTFEHVGKIFNAVYSPIENKDYYEDISVTRERDMTDNTTRTAERTRPRTKWTPVHITLLTTRTRTRQQARWYTARRSGTRAAPAATRQ